MQDILTTYFSGRLGSAAVASAYIVDDERFGEFIIVNAALGNGSRPPCPLHGAQCKPSVHTKKTIAVADAPHDGLPVEIRLTINLYRCSLEPAEADGGAGAPPVSKPLIQPFCGWFDPESRVTNRFVDYLRRRIVDTTFAQISRESAVSEQRLKNVFMQDSQFWERVCPDTSAPVWLGIDQTHLGRRHDHRNGDTAFVLTDIKERRIIDVLTNASGEDLKTRLNQFTETERLEAIVADHAGDIRKAVMDSKLSNVPIIIDRFHVVQLGRGKFDEIRKGLEVQLSKAGRIAEAERLHKNQNVFRKTVEELKREASGKAPKLPPNATEKQKAAILRGRQIRKDLLAAHPELEQALTLVEQFRAIYEAKTRAGAIRRYEAWKRKVQVSKHHLVQKHLGKLIEHVDKNPHIFNFFDANLTSNQRPTNGYTEKVNDLVQNLYGSHVKNLALFRARVLLKHGKRTFQTVESIQQEEEREGMVFVVEDMLLEKKGRKPVRWTAENGIVEDLGPHAAPVPDSSALKRQPNRAQAARSKAGKKPNPHARAGNETPQAEAK